MKKLFFSILLAAVAFLMGSCLKKVDVMPPMMTVTGDDNSFQYFSTIQAAEFDVHIESGEELRALEVKTLPLASWNDTAVYFDKYTHKADVSLDFLMKRGTPVVKDSTYFITFTAYTDDTLCSIKRKIKYKYIYPEVDSFDVELGADYNDNCLLNIERREAYSYTQYKNLYYDLVFVADQRYLVGGFAIGIALASPNAPYLKDYFNSKFPGLEYNEENGLRHRQTICGYVTERVNSPDNITSLSWDDFNSAMLGMEDGWANPIYLLSSQDYGFGYGVNNLEHNMLYKFKLHNGRYAMVRVLSKENEIYSDAKVKFRIYVQKK